MIKIANSQVLEKRGNDKWGSGEWGAKRGSRRHMGVDYKILPGDTVLSLTEGVVTKLGYPYADDLSYRYVEVEDANEYKLRYFYILPSVKVGQMVAEGEPLGIAQSLDRRYEGITEHIHFEVKNDIGELINPEKYIKDHYITV